MRITFLKGVFGTPDGGHVVDMTASEFLDDMGKPDGSASVECADDAAKKRGWGFVLAQYRPGATEKLQTSLEPASSTEILCYDIDAQSRAAVDAAWPVWAGLDAAVYSTMKHTPALPRLRLLVRLSRPVANASGTEYGRLYHAVAHLLGIEFDPSTKDLARFFIAPQHRPGALGDSWRFRFNGVPLPVDAILGMLDSGQIPPAAVTVPVSSRAAGPRRLPNKAALGKIAARLLSSSTGESVGVGAVLEAVLAGRPFAEQGAAHVAQRDMVFALVRSVPLFDGDAFAEKYMGTVWGKMPWVSESTRLTHWHAMVDSAEAKLEADHAVKEAEAVASAQFAPSLHEVLSDGDKAAAGALSGALVNEHRGNFYVWDARARRYVGPIKGTGLSAACRDGLMGVPNFQYQSYGKGVPVLKSGPRLVEEYGFRLDMVNFWAVPPAVVFDAEAKAIHTPAYHWNTWDAVEHPIAGEFLIALFGEQLPRGLAWLAKFTDLTQPLPALVLVGPKGVWKSQIPQILSRFWGPRAAGTPCRAEQVLNKFSMPLLRNPVIHTDETMARTETGRAIPERYRESIMSKVHMVETKGVDPVALHTATRHIVSVNDLDQVFGGGEVDAASVEATVERYMVVEVDGARMAEFEARWAPYPEAIGALREGTTLLEHVAWLQQNHEYVGTCRLWVDTGTDADVLLRARFADDTLVMCMSLAVEALLAETRHSHKGQLARLPLVLDEGGRLRLSASRIVDLWADSPITAGSGLRKPSVPKVGRMLQKAGLKLHAAERPCDSRKWAAWAVNHVRLREYLQAEGTHTWAEIEHACEIVWNRRVGQYG